MRESIRKSRIFTHGLTLDVQKKLEGLGEFIELGEGAGFGELALINDNPRGATILCKSNCDFAVMNK